MTGYTIDNVYRLHINKKEEVHVTTYGIEKSDMELELFYSSVDLLPEWVQSKLSMLMMFPADAESYPEVPKVGWRISPNVFWIYPEKL